tara:strand:+ start:272 stop:523 length:252 start_codon:yes stop_codon:yes gene_type:complete
MDKSEESYRKKFPKGKDWKDPKPNPFGHCGLNPSSYHGMETIGISMDKHNEVVKELEDKILELETELYFCYRNNKIEKEINDR